MEKFHQMVFRPLVKKVSHKGNATLKHVHVGKYLQFITTLLTGEGSTNINITNNFTP